MGYAFGGIIFYLGLRKLCFNNLLFFVVFYYLNRGLEALGDLAGVDQSTLNASCLVQKGYNLKTFTFHHAPFVSVQYALVFF